MLSAINAALLNLARRAERRDPAILVRTFVDVGPLLALLQSVDHQVVFGRRGTGKTHALRYLAEIVKLNCRSDLSLLIDLRQLGSSGGLYADSRLPETERGTRLLIDVMEAIHERLVDTALSDSTLEARGTSALGLLDQFADQISQVHVVGSVEREVSSSGERQVMR